MVEYKKFLIILLFLSYLFADSPYSLQKFRGVLDVSKLQAPISSYNALYSRKYGDFQFYENKYFYLQDRDYMVFFMCGYRHRSELRFKKEWKTNTKTLKSIQAEVKLFPLNEKREFTFLQVHADSILKKVPTINKPLLRVVWYKELHKKHNHLWAVIRMDDNLSATNYQKIDLGSMPKGFFNVKIEVLKNWLSVFVNSKRKVHKNVDYWQKYHNYFKAGVYLQDKGCAKVLFKKLKIKD